MSEKENGSQEEHAKWKAPEGGQEAGEKSEKSSIEVKFNPNRRPGIPRGAGRQGGDTEFHRMAKLWDDAKEVFDQTGKTDSEAAARYEEYSNWVDRSYGVVVEGMKAAEKAVKEAGLNARSKEGDVLYGQTRVAYEQTHREQPPSWASEKFHKEFKRKTAE